MRKKTIAISVAAAFVAAVLSAGGAYLLTEKNAISRIMEVQAEATAVKDELFGYTKYTDYIAAGKQVLTEQAKFLAVKVDRADTMVEHVHTSRFWVSSDATVIVNYTVEYSFGYDLKPESFEVRAIPSGIELKIGKPILVASPAVKPLKYEIPSRGFLVNEEAAVIDIQQRLPGIAQGKGVTMASEEPIRAVCEKKLVEFLRDFLGKQPGVKHVPAITIVYK